MLACVICYKEEEEQESKESLPCGHTFCLKCIAKWFATEQDTCPLCIKWFELSELSFELVQRMNHVELLRQIRNRAFFAQRRRTGMHDTFMGLRIARPLTTEEQAAATLVSIFPPGGLGNASYDPSEPINRDIPVVYRGTNTRWLLDDLIYDGIYDASDDADDDSLPELMDYDDMPELASAAPATSDNYESVSEDMVLEQTILLRES